MLSKIRLVLSVLSGVLLLFGSYNSFGQSCTTTISTNVNWSSLTAANFIAAGGATCPPTSPFTGNVFITINSNKTLTMDAPLTITGNFDLTMANNTNIIFSNDVTVNGSFPLVNSGNSTLTVNSGNTVHVTQDMGDPTNNNVNFVVNGTLQVDGTLSSKQNTDFTGTGSISGGTLNIGSNGTCGTPCPVEGGFTTCTSGDAFCTNNLVPIKLLFFKATPGLNNISLTWATYEEKNFDYFSIERSFDGLNFTEMAQQKGHGWSTSIINYSFEDNHPIQGRSYYRLKSVDFDGYTEYFSIVSVFYTGVSDMFSVYPNPVQGNDFNLSINQDPGVGGRLRIYSVQGAEVYSKDLHKGQLQYNISDFSKKGLYVFKVDLANSSFQRKVVIE